MIDMLTESAQVLETAGFATARISIGNHSALAVEDHTILAFIIAYRDAHELREQWRRDTNEALAKNAFALRRAGKKAWNTYLVLLAGADGSHSSTPALASIEEDLSGTRKIARAGIRDVADLQAALLPLLPLQSEPRLEAVDSSVEIRERSTELSPKAVDAYLSAADEAVVLQILEETP